MREIPHCCHKCCNSVSEKQGQLTCKAAPILKEPSFQNFDEVLKLLVRVKAFNFRPRLQSNYWYSLATSYLCVSSKPAQVIIDAGQYNIQLDFDRQCSSLTVGSVYIHIIIYKERSLEFPIWSWMLFYLSKKALWVPSNII